MFELDNNKRRENLVNEDKKRDAEVRRGCEGQSRFTLGKRSHLAAGNGLAPGDQQYPATDTTTGEVFLVFDRRTAGKCDLAADIRRQLTAHI